MNSDMSGFLWFIVIGSTILVALDASHLDAGKHKLGGMADTSAAVWTLGTLLLWIVVLPLYLITRPKILAAWKAEQAAPPAVTIPQRRCAVCETLYDTQYDRCPRCAKGE